MQHTAFGGVTIASFIKVQKVDGRVFYFKVIDNGNGAENIPITEKEYKENHE